MSLHSSWTEHSLFGSVAASGARPVYTLPEGWLYINSGGDEGAMDILFTSWNEYWAREIPKNVEVLVLHMLTFFTFYVHHIPLAFMTD